MGLTTAIDFNAKQGITITAASVFDLFYQCIRKVYGNP